MLFIENIKFAFTALFNSKVRSLLTMLCVIIGVFSVSILMAIGDGLKKEFGQQIQELGSNIVVVTPGKIDIESGNFNPSASFGVSTLTESDAEKILEEVDLVEKNAPMTLLSATPKYDDHEILNLLPMSTSPTYFEIVENELAAGEYFTQQEFEEKQRVVVLGGGAAKKIIQNSEEGEQTDQEIAQELIGKKLTLLGEDFLITGVLKIREEALNFGSSDANDVIVTPRSVAKEITGEDVVYRILNKIKSAEEVENAKNRIREVVKANHKDVEDFSVLTQEDVLNVFNSFFSILTQAVLSIAAISLIVGGIGIMNIMLVSVTERTKEIGLRKAIGATNGNILVQFLTEASTLSIVGGIIGILCAIGGGILIQKFANIPTIVSWKSFIIAFGISVATGIIFGIMPASKAARKHPIEALRYE